MRRLRGADAAFVYGETPTWHMHVASLIILDPATSGGGFSFGNFRRMITERLPLVPQLSWRLVEAPLGLDFPGWVEDADFDIDYHIRRIAVPSPGGRTEVQDLVGRLASYKLNREKPLWELWVIEGLDGGKLGIFTKTHHALFDGISGAGIMELLFDISPEPRPAPTDVVHERIGSSSPSQLALLAEGVANTALRTPFRVGRYARQLLRQAPAAIAAVRSPEPPSLPFQNPPSVLSARLTAHRSFSYTTLNFDRVKAIKDLFGVKVNDVVLAMTAGAVARYLAARGELPAQPLVAQMAVSLRAEGDQEVANKIGGMWVSLATDLDDAGDRLRAIAADTGRAKDMHRALSVHRIMGLTDTTPPGLIALAARMYTRAGLESRLRSGNLTVSNVPGPPIPMYVAGAKVLGVHAIGPILLGGGINVTVMSYNGELNLGIVACPETIPELDEIADGFAEELKALEESAGPRATPAKKAAKRKAHAP